MILNLGQICSIATRYAGGRNDWTLSEASQYANFALTEVAAVVGHTPLEAIAVSSTTSGENRIALPTDFHSALALTLYKGSFSTATTSNMTTSITLEARDAQWVDAQALNGLDGNTAGVPEAYVQYATWFTLYPSPNSAYSLQLRYFAKPSVLVDSTDTPALDERYHQAVVFKTAEHLEASRANVEGEAIARNRYLNYISLLPTDQALKQKDKRSMVLRYVKRWPS